MKLVRFGAPGREKPGMLDAQGRIRDLSKIVPDIAGDGAIPEGPRQAAQAQARKTAARARHAAARPVRRQNRQFHRHRTELFRSRRRSRHADAERADHLQQGAELHLRAERRHHDPERLDQARLRSRARHRHRQPRPLPRQEQGDGRGRRLLPRQRRIGAVFSDRAQRRPMGQGQELRDFRPARAVARHQGRDQRPAAARHVAHGQRRNPAEGHRPPP